MRRPYRLALPTPSTVCLQADPMVGAKMNHRNSIGLSPRL